MVEMEIKSEKTCSKHKKSVEKYEGNLHNLAEDIGNLHYESLSEFLGYLSHKIKIDSRNDKAKNRDKLSNTLRLLSVSLEESMNIANESWEICKPFMDDKS